MKTDFAIVIPTYNRAHCVGGTLLKHCNILSDFGLDNVDVVVSINGSADNTLEVVESVARKYPFVKVLRQPQFCDTGEEHIYRACRAIDYKYVWMFGDDDIPLPAGIFKIMPALRSGKFDFVLGNMKSVSSATGEIMKGNNEHEGLIETSTNKDLTIEDLVAHVGFQSAAACVSAVAFNREKFLQGNFERYFEVSPIYSHVATYLHAFKNSRCLYIAEPVFMYNYGATRMNNWTQFSKRRHTHVFDPWTTGIIRLFQELRHQDCITDHFLFTIREHDPHHIYALWAHILNVTLSTFETSLAEESTKALFAQADIDEMARELSLSPTSYEGSILSNRILRLSQVLRAAFSSYSVDQPNYSVGRIDRPISVQSLPSLFRCIDSATRSEVLSFIKHWAREEIETIRSRMSVRH